MSDCFTSKCPGNSLQESRMVGTALYVASQTYRVIPNGTGATWETGTLVSSFDLADPDAPVARDTLWYPGGGNVIAATDIYLFVVTQNPTDWWKSIVNLVDITAPDGSLAGYGSLHTAGRVPDQAQSLQAGFTRSHEIKLTTVLSQYFN